MNVASARESAREIPENFDMALIVAFEKIESGNYRAVFPEDKAAPAVKSSTLDGLLDQLRTILAIEIPDPLTDEERERQDKDDAAAARDAIEEIEREGTIPWEQAKAELGL